MLINIVCSDKGWIYDEFITAFQKYSVHEIVRNSKQPCDLTHYIPYYELPKSKHLSHPCSAWFSHQEVKSPLKQKFISAGQSVDLAISQSKKYLKVLQENGAKDAIQIMAGVDVSKYQLRTSRAPGDKLVIGYVGRQYTSSNRKNPRLLNKIAKLPFVDFRSTDGKLDIKDIPAFYRELDLVVSPALVEGGPMALQESLLAGVPFMCFDNVGVSREFDLGVIRVAPHGDDEAFINKLHRIWKDKIHLTWYNQAVMKRTREQVEKYTWANFVKKHDEAFNELVEQNYR